MTFDPKTGAAAGGAAAIVTAPPVTAAATGHVGDRGASTRRKIAYVVLIGYAIPGFLFAILLIVLFAGGSFWQVFPLRGLTSEGWSQLSLGGKALDYLWHISLPITAMALGAFATLLGVFVKTLPRVLVAGVIALGGVWLINNLDFSSVRLPTALQLGSR